MRKRKTILTVLVALSCLWISGKRQDTLVAERSKYHLDSGQPLENAPPLVTFTTVVFGGFSGFLADFLWLRVSYLQDEGKYLEIVQLADWITKLEPRCAEIWGFHAWNMAYNVSIAMTRPEDRWRWVNNGVKLLRDEGMRYNPADAPLYLDLAWMLLNKIGSDTDRAHAYYKCKWAEEMGQLFDGPRPDYDKTESNPELSGLMEKNYKLVPKIMKEVDAQFGPLDWRLPQAHAIYWAYRGRPHSMAKHTIQFDRMIYQAMTSSFGQGLLVSAESPEKLMLAPNLEIFEATVRTFDRAIQKYRLEPVRSAYAIFLRHAVALFWGFEQPEKAHRAFDLLAAKFPSSETAAGFDNFIAGVKAEMEARSR